MQTIKSVSFAFLILIVSVSKPETTKSFGG